MSSYMQAIRFSNLDQARQVLARHCRYTGPDIFLDAGEEPQGLLAIVPPDRVPEETFYRLFNATQGTVVGIEVVDYSGFGPPARERDYMGFVSEQKAYILEGQRLPVAITRCPLGARDIHHLEAMTLTREHPLDRKLLENRLLLEPDWDFEDLFDLIADGQLTAELVDRLLHDE